MNSWFRTVGRKLVAGAALVALVLGGSNLSAQSSSDTSGQGGWKARGSQAAPQKQEPASQPVFRRTSAEEAFNETPATAQTPPKLFEAPINQSPVIVEQEPVIQEQPSGFQPPPWQRPPRRRPQGPPGPGRQVRYQPGNEYDGPVRPMSMRIQAEPEPIGPGNRVGPGSSSRPQGPSYSRPGSSAPFSSGPHSDGTIYSGPITDGTIPGDGSWIDGSYDGMGGPMGGCSSCSGGSCGVGCGGPCDPYYEYGRPGLLDGLIGDLFQHPGWCCNNDNSCYGPYGWWRPWVIADESSVFLGTTSFKGPVDQGQNGNFGFQEGFNVAGAFLDWMGLGYQIGGNFVQSNFHGDFVETVRTQSRDQQFYTVGLFHRAWYGHGLQYGVVADFLHDNYYVRYDLKQARFEISYIFNGGHELGYWGTAANTTVTVTSQDLHIPQTLQPANMNAIFYRYNLCNGSQGRFWLGGAGSKQGLVGADFRVPITNRWDLNGRFNYLIPNGAAGLQGQQQEGWGMSMNLVFYPGRAAHGCHNGPYRPLFNVADNSTFMVRRTQ